MAESLNGYFKIFILLAKKERKRDGYENCVLTDLIHWKLDMFFSKVQNFKLKPK